jgi:ABC-type uncharacterized transport system permease subunit
LLIAIALAIIVYIFLWRTTIGYRIRAVGFNPEAARYSGIHVPFYQALSLTLAGGFAGIAGAIEVLGVQHRLLEGITSGYGFPASSQRCLAGCTRWAPSPLPSCLARCWSAGIKCSARFKYRIH